MNAYYHWLNSLVNQNKSEYAAYPEINWLNPYQAEALTEQREKLLSGFHENALFGGTKPYYGSISPGCQRCGQGQWSCLFITGKCNAGCFYCPTPQNSDDTPTTQGLTFGSAKSYAQYIKHWGYTGVSFSGGEPLLFFERTLEYIREVKNINPAAYIWMYTNGILFTKEKARLLAEAGLNEIRFDIGATQYKLDKVALANGIIENVTIEIPAVPEEKDTLLTLLPAMAEHGVKYLNLHQLRLTPHNVKHIVKRGYTIIPAEKPLVLESELAALEILHNARKNAIPLGINYCSFHFKHRYQKAGFRKMAAKALIPDAEVTENGYVRNNAMDNIGYYQLAVTNTEAPSGNSKLYEKEGLKIWCDLHQVSEIPAIPGKTVTNNSLLYKTQFQLPPDDETDFKIWQMECIEQGFREY